MLSVFWFDRSCVKISCAVYLYASVKCVKPLYVILITLLCASNVPLYAADGRASFASLLAGGLSPVGLGGYRSTPARFADPAYGTSFYWMDDVDDFSWSLSLDFGDESYRVGAFSAYESMDSLYRCSYWEFDFARIWTQFAVGAAYALDMEWNPGDAFWTRHRFKLGADYALRVGEGKVHLAGMMSFFTDEGANGVVGAHWISDESVSAFAEYDFDYLYVGAVFRWKFLEICSSYRFPDFAVAVELSVSWGRVGASYARGFKHNSLGWNGVHISRRMKNEMMKNN